MHVYYRYLEDPVRHEGWVLAPEPSECQEGRLEPHLETVISIKEREGEQVSKSK